MLVSNIVQQFKTRVKTILADNFKDMYWFGSTVQAQARPDADIDLLIETKYPVTASQRNQIADVAIDLCAKTGIVLDVHYYTSEEINHPPYSRSPFIETITREGVHA